MTKEEVKALIKAKIEGQGTNVDAGSVLPAILNGILDLIDGAGAITVVTSISAQSTDVEVPSAKCVYDNIGDIETLLAAL